MRILFLIIMLILVGCKPEYFSVNDSKHPEESIHFPDQFLFGQPDFGYSSMNTGGIAANRLKQPEAIYFDGKRVYLCDRDNFRLLIWNDYKEMLAGSSVINPEPDIVLQQPNFTTGTSGVSQNKMAACRGILTIGNKLLVADSANHRVLVWNSIPTVSNTPPDVVIGQANFNVKVTTVNDATLNQPQGMATDGVRLFVADRMNNRIMVWNTVPTVNGTPADLVLGQASFTTNSCNRGGTASARSFCQPIDVDIFAGKLYVTDRNNHRLLVWNSIPASESVDADFVIGQSVFTTSASNSPSRSEKTFYNPWNTVVDAKGIYVADYGNSRLMIFNHPISMNAQSASKVIGQSNFTDRVVGNGEGEVDGIIGVIRIGDHFIFADQDNHRLISDILQKTAP